MKTALVLSGGGARAAYQVGVLKALSELLPGNPFNIVCGTSSGALNAAKLACDCDDFSGSVKLLEKIWANLDSAQVHCVGYRELLGSVFRLFASFFHRGIALGRPLSLLDNSPLQELLHKNIDFTRLAQLIDQQHLHALCITALGYSSGNSVCFFQGHETLSPWKAANRIGLRCELDHRHILASSALPTIFPAVSINREYFGDGAMRQTAPMSAALHLGAKKLFVVGVSGNVKHAYEREKVQHSPSLAQVMSQLLNSAFIDSLEEDVEMLTRFNAFARCMNDEQQHALKIRPVDLLVIEPSIRFDQLAAQYINCLPQSMRLLLRMIGADARGGGSSLASYILFEKEFCQELIRCGYADAINQDAAIINFFRTKSE
jgi:NTE family protein